MKRILFIASVVAGLFAGMTANAQKDARTREYITPVRVVWTNSTDLISNPDALLQEGNGQADFMQRAPVRFTLQSFLISERNFMEVFRS